VAQAATFLLLRKVPVQISAKAPDVLTLEFSSLGASEWSRTASITLRHSHQSVCLPACISMAPIGRTLVKFGNGGFYKNPSRKSKCA